MGYSKLLTKEEVSERRKELYNKNLEKNRKYGNDRYHKNKEQILKKMRKRYRNDPKFKFRKDTANKRLRSTREFKDKRNLREKKLRKYWRDELINVLGGYICKECNYNKSKIPLQIDHIKGNGRQERKKNSDTSRYYKKYAKEPNLARKTLQVLCSNCNQIKKFANKEF